LRVLFIIISVWCLSFFAHARSLDDIIESKYIVIAVYNDYLPFSAKVAGEPVGIDVEIASVIAASLNVELRLKWMTADESSEDDLRNNLWKGHFLDKTKADLMLRVPYDKDYKLKRDDVGLLVHEQVHMFAPYHTETWKIVFDTARLEAVPTMALFQYHPIGVEIDSIPQFYLMSAFRGSMRENTRQFDTLDLAVQGMVNAEVDAVMGLRSQITSLHHQLKSSTSQKSSQYQLANNAFPLLGKQKWDIGMAVHTDFRALGYSVGDIVFAMIDDGRMANIFAKHHAHFEIPTYYSE
jgi:polar amino acid transport system substrate-binding protein